jgi:hypothetical protein
MKSRLKNGVFWVLTRATRRNNPEDTILHSHRRENLKSYEVSFVPLCCCSYVLSHTYMVRRTWNVIPLSYVVYLNLKNNSRMTSSGMLRNVALVRPGVSEERLTTMIMVLASVASYC